MSNFSRQKKLTDNCKFTTLKKYYVRLKNTFLNNLKVNTNVYHGALPRT